MCENGHVFHSGRRVSKFNGEEEGWGLAAALERGLGWGWLAPGTPHLSPSIDRFRIVPLAYTPLIPPSARLLLGPPQQHLINWAHLWGEKGGKSALENFGFVAGGASPRFRRGAYVGRGDLACFPLPLDSISSGHPRKQAATQGRRGGGLAECSMLSSVGRRTTVVLTTGPLWDQYDARRDVCSPTPHRLTLGALREFKFAPL